MLTTATRRPLLLASVSLIAALMAPAAPASAARGMERCAGAMEIPLSEAQLPQAAGAIVCLVNAERTSRGLAALKRNPDLARAARGHSRDMTRRKFFSHISTDGDSVGDRTLAAGYGDPLERWRVGENLGWGTGSRATPNARVDEWLDSPAHRRLLLAGVYRELGVGVALGVPKSRRRGLPGATYTLNLGVIR